MPKKPATERPMDPLKRLEALRAFVKSEQAMRRQVFQRDPVKLRKKVAECDEALGHLEVLEAEEKLRRHTQRDPAEQAGLFPA